MDAKAVATRIYRRLHWDHMPNNPCGEAELKAIIEELEAIEEAQKPVKEKTRGEVVAERSFYLYNGLSMVHFMFGDGTELTPGNLARAKGSLASLIDSERASAAKEERERVIKVITQRMEEGHKADGYKALRNVAQEIEGRGD